MTERPILFSAPMVRALLEGRKTQTRRVVKNLTQEPDGRWRFGRPSHAIIFQNEARVVAPDGAMETEYAAYRPGDRLWVRETWGVDWYDDGNTQAWKRVVYRSDEDKRPSDNGTPMPWRPSIYMPRWASRITLLVKDVRVQRLQDISEEDARAEGCSLEWYSDNAGEENLWPCAQCDGWQVHSALGAGLGVIEVDCRRCDTAVGMFRELWNSINGPGSWDANPWVYAVSFEVEKAKAEAVAA